MSINKKEYSFRSKYGRDVYEEIKELPIIDYHCHLDAAQIAADEKLPEIGELWLSGDHYKWRAMRLCGVEESYITGGASYEEKFLKYAEILPKLAGNPLYEWTHLELEQIFGIGERLNGESARRIYSEANEKLKDMRVSSLLKRFKVEYIATTDDPIDKLTGHGRTGTTTVAPTFRPDRVYGLDEEYLNELGQAAGIEISSLGALLKALERRLDYFVSKGCKIADHGFERFPRAYASQAEAESLFGRRKTWSEPEKDAFFGYLLLWLTREYKKRGMLMQLHFSVIRNANAELYKICGRDSGFDVIGAPQSGRELIGFLNGVKEDERPETLLYTLNAENLPELASIAGAFRHVRLGAAWWFNDTAEGIRTNLKTIAEYACLGTALGMLTDSRSFSSYVRFDFFRRILSEYLGELADAGRCDAEEAKTLAKDIAYYNIKGELGL